MSFFSSKKLLIGVIIALLLAHIYVILQINNVNIIDVAHDIYLSLPNLIAKKPTCKNCNIILVSIDTLGANHLPCYGYKRDTSPNLCKFAQENIIVRDMSANSSYTLASHASIFTGIYPREHGVNIPNVDRLNNKISFLPEELKKNGYEVYFCMTTSDPHLPIDKVYNRGIDHIFNTHKLEHWNTCLKKLESNNKKGKKTFIFLHIYRVHSPYLAPLDVIEDAHLTTKKIPTIPETTEEFFSMKYDEDFFVFFIKKLEEDLANEFWGTNSATIKHYTNLLSSLKKMNAEGNMRGFLDDIQNEYIISEYLGAYYSYKVNSIPKKQVDRLSDIYDLTIMEVDSFLGTMLTRLKKTKIWNNTIIAITSDHGEEFMEHGKFVGHGANLYNTTTRVPLIMRVPTIQRRNVVVPAESVDIYPTLLDIVGIKKPQGLSGSNIFGIKNGIQRQDLFYNDYHVRTIRNDNWKLILKKEKSTSSSRELYDVSVDVKEENNLFFKERAKVKQLLQMFLDQELSSQKKHY